MILHEMAWGVFISLLLAFSVGFVSSSAIPAPEPATAPSEEALDFSPVANVSVLPARRSLWSLPRSVPPGGIDATETGFKKLTYKPPTCNGAAYGRELQPASCQEAFFAIPRDTARISFGRRNRGRWNINLPYRFLSSRLTPSCWREEGVCERRG